MKRRMPGKNTKEKLEHAQRLLESGMQASERNDLSEALLYYLEAYQIRADVFGPEQPEVSEVIAAFIPLLDKAQERAQERSANFRAMRAYFQSVLEQYENPTDPQYLAMGWLLEGLGNLLNSDERLEEALQIFNDAQVVYEHALGPQDRQVLFLLQRQVGLTYNLGDLQGAKKLFERVLALDTALFGQDHPKYAADLASLGSVYKDMGALQDARGIYEQAIAISEKSLNWDNPRLVNDLSALSEICAVLGDYPAALATQERVLAIDVQTFGENHPKIALDLSTLGDLHQKHGDLPAAFASQEKALAIETQVFSAEDSKVAARLVRLAELQRQMGDLTGARERYQRALSLDEKAFGEGHPKIVPDLEGLGEVQAALGERSAAAASFSRALAILETYLPAGDPKIQATREQINKL